MNYNHSMSLFVLGAVFVNIGIFGGDLRQIHLYELLKSKHRKVDILYNRIRKKECLCYDVILLPLPVTKDGKHLLTPFIEENVELETIFKEHKSARFFGGAVSKAVTQQAAQHSIRIVDYYLDEMLLKKNAALTADGAIELLSDALNVPQKVMIVGFGRIGKALCDRLNNMNVDFCVTARKESDFQLINALGYRSIETGKIRNDIGDYSLIINTVPSLVLGEAELRNCKPECRILDLASAPYGTDFNYCDKKHITYDIAPGIPGKLYPAKASNAIFETIEQFLKSEE